MGFSNIRRGSFAVFAVAAFVTILVARHLGRTAPRRIAALCVVAFSAALTLLWGITFLSQTHTV